MKKLLPKLCLFLLPFLLLCGCDTGEEIDEPGAAAADYVSFEGNTRYVYEGDGNEYASFDIYVDFMSESRIQQRVESPGTVVLRVLEALGDRLVMVRSAAEVYHRDNMLTYPSQNEEVLIAEPIELGTTWALADGRTRSITNLSVPVRTPAGNYDAREVTKVGTGGTPVEYYAKGVGMVKSVFRNDAYEVSSTLSEIRRDAAYTQNITFYLPDEEGNITSTDREVTFRTNDVTADVLAEAYKSVAEEAAGRVLTTNTRINSLYLRDDNVAVIDVSEEILTEMNAGAGFERAILQSLANTLGAYYLTDRVQLTVNGAPYESGHIRLGEGEYLIPDIE